MPEFPLVVTVSAHKRINGRIYSVSNMVASEVFEDHPIGKYILKRFSEEFAKAEKGQADEHQTLSPQMYPPIDQWEEM